MASIAHEGDTSSKAPTSPARKKTPQAEMTLKGHHRWVRGVAFIPGTRLLVSCSHDKSLRVWDLDTGQQVGEPLLGHDDEVRTVAASTDGRWIVSGASNGSILTWEVATNKSVPVSFKSHENMVHSIVFAPNSETFASASWDETQQATDKSIIVWNAASGKELFKIQQRAWRIAFTPDGLRLVSGNMNDIRISDAATGDIIKKFDAHTKPFLSLAIAPNSTKFATTAFDQTTRFFDLSTFEPIGEPFEHPDWVSSVTFSEDSQLIVTGCGDTLVRTWTVPQSESEKESQQASKFFRHASAHEVLGDTVPGLESGPEEFELPHGFFDDHDMRSPSQRKTRTTPHDKGFRIKNFKNYLLSRSSAPRGHDPYPRSIPVVDVFATRGKYRTANAISGKRHLVQPPRPPRRQAHTFNAGTSRPQAGTSNIFGRPTPATLQTTSTDAHTATSRPNIPLGSEHVVQYDTCYSPQRNNRTARTTSQHHAEGSRVFLTVSCLAPQDRAPAP
ncbi:WD40-repeat-containing domain protein [Suillus paluster]|uniref:WD40-repeat-containing domain protein n=1 Tax=Suillus paluster TaxID=48578 RepID=UPI001B868A92|nr:WD40-repeat-containing domain protein [Suillus paluster]KAG1724753.1 WD40-repeat-containing domain protein [Suillus paluster]